jgi:hypothetical protein
MCFTTLDAPEIDQYAVGVFLNEREASTGD